MALLSGVDFPVVAEAGSVLRMVTLDPNQDHNR